MTIFSMRKNTTLISGLLPVLFYLVSPGCMGQDINITNKAFKDTSVYSRDGAYEARSRAKYVGEPFWGIVNITIKDGSITDILFVIRDSSLHETFNENYEKHFEGIPEYIEQSRNDWKGVQIYPKRFSETNDLNKIDAITGATWSYNIFRAAAEKALKKAQKQTEILTVPDSIKE